MFLIRNLCSKLPSIKDRGRFGGKTIYYNPGQSSDLGNEDSNYSSIVLSDWETMGTETQFTYENLNH